MKDHKKQNKTHQDPTYNLPWPFTFSPNNENDPMVDTHLLVEGFGRNLGKMTSSENKTIISKLAGQVRRRIFRKCFFFILYLQIDIE